MARGVGGQSPSNIAKHLHGVDFPASRDQVVDRARRNGAPEEVAAVLEMMPDRTFHSMADLMESVGEVE